MGSNIHANTLSHCFTNSGAEQCSQCLTDVESNNSPVSLTNSGTVRDANRNAFGCPYGAAHCGSINCSFGTPDGDT